MNDNHFFLTLSSNSNCEFSAENKASNFKVHLGRVIELTGCWQVALFELYYPATLPNLRAETCMIHRENVTTALENNELVRKKVAYTLDSKYYHTEQQLLDEINNKMPEIFACEMKDKKTIIKCNPIASNNERIEIILAPVLKDILGFQRNQYFKPNMVIQSEYLTDLKRGISSTLSVQTDLIKEQYINNSHIRVLRTVLIDAKNYKHGFQRRVEFSKLAFLPVAKKRLEFIHVYINDDNNEEASFSHGFSTVVLLFRRVANE